MNKTTTILVDKEHYYSALSHPLLAAFCTPVLIDLTKSVELPQVQDGLVWLDDLTRAKYIAEKNKIGYIDTDAVFSVYTGNEIERTTKSLDLQDIEPSDLAKFVLFIRTYTTYKTTPNGENTFFYPYIPFHYTLPFGTYLGENQFTIDFIKRVVKQNKRTLIQASAGTGKTTLLPNYKALATELGYKRVIFVVPTIPIAQQTEAGLSDETKAITTLVCTTKNKAHEAEKAQAAQFGIIIAVSDSFVKLGELLNDSLIVVDECHTLITDMNYRANAMRRAFDMLINCTSHVVFLSATPLYCFCSKQFVGLDFTLLECITDAQNRPQIQPIEHKLSRPQLLQAVLGVCSKYSDATHFVKLDYKAFLDSFSKDLDARGLLSERLYSGDASRKEENENYKNVMQDGKLKNPNIKFLFATSLLQAGVSFKFQSTVNILQWNDSIELVQLAIRPRYDQKTGINERTPVHVFYKSQKPKSPFFFNWDNFKRLADEAQQYLQNVVFDETKERTNRTTYDTPFLYATGDGYKFSLLDALYHYYEADKASTGIEKHLQRVKMYDSRFNILEPSKIATNGLIFENTAQMMLDRKEANEARKSLFLDNPHEFLQCLAIAAPNKPAHNHLKEWAKVQYRNVAIMDNNTVQKAVELKELLTTAPAYRIARNAITVLELGGNLETLKNSIINPSDFAAVKNALIHKQRKEKSRKGVLDALQLKSTSTIALIARKVQQQLFNLKRAEKEPVLKQPQIMKYAGGKIRLFKQVLDGLRCYFDIEKKRDKTGFFYTFKPLQNEKETTKAKREKQVHRNCKG